MSRLWRIVLMVILAAALPLRAFAMPTALCCHAGASDQAAHATVETAMHASDAAAAGGSDCGDCTAEGDAAGMSHGSCVALCAAVAATSMHASAADESRASVLVAHPESIPISNLPRRLERPPKPVLI